MCFDLGWNCIPSAIAIDPSLSTLIIIGHLANWIRVIPWFALPFSGEKVHIFKKLHISCTFISDIKVLEIESMFL